MIHLRSWNGVAVDPGSISTKQPKAQFDVASGSVASDRLQFLAQAEPKVALIEFVVVEEQLERLTSSRVKLWFLWFTELMMPVACCLTQGGTGVQSE
jgi:hypothetical protein